MIIRKFQLKPKIWLFTPFENFLKYEHTSSILLLSAAIISFVLANTSYSEAFFHLWHLNVGISVGNWAISYSLQHWINDFLMSIFFFNIGLEIKREVIAGELSSIKKAMLPIIAAIGGMALPAIIYILFNHNAPSISGWGIPTATDIAFTLGAIKILGKRVPLALTIFLTALAIVDDLGAVLIIAIFYSSNINLTALFQGGIFLSFLIISNIIGIMSPLFYFVISMTAVWFSFLQAGIHPTIAGVLAAFTVPATRKINLRSFIENMDEVIKKLKEDCLTQKESKLTQISLRNLFKIKQLYEQATSPLQKIEKYLHFWSAYLILPLFALANAGIDISLEHFSNLLSPVGLGVLLGLFLGKPLGIFFAVLIGLKLNICSLPTSLKLKDIFVGSSLAGIGFTMSLFITNLAFNNNEYIAISKLAILLASILSFILGVSVAMQGKKYEETIN